MKCPYCDSVIKNKKIAVQVIAKFGGVAHMSDLTGIKKQTIYRWTYPKNKHNGTGGSIPLKHHQAIVECAQKNGIELTLGDLI